ncbi:hypothetical protein PspLS_03931, partial [Pyricularia sp. CBS 133598]
MEKVLFSDYQGKVRNHNYLSRFWQNRGSHILSAKGSLGCPVSFFFAQADNANSLDAETIFGFILCQRLLKANISEETGVKIRKAVATSDFSGIVDLLREVTPTFRKSYIVFDGLDECDKGIRKIILKRLATLVLFNNSEEVERHFAVKERLKLGQESTNEYIAAYIKGFLEEKVDDGDLKVGDPALLSEIQAVLTEGAQRIYEAAAQNAFTWLVASKRPLSLGKLREALSIYIGQQYTEPNRLYNDMENISSWCGNLVQVNEESRLVQFAHSTVKDFLLEEPNAHDLQGFHFNLRDIDHRLGKLCITYLDFNDFKTTLAVRSRPVVVDPSKVAGTLFKPGLKRVAILLKTDFGGTQEYDMKFDSKTADLEAGNPFLNYASIHGISHTKNLQKSTSRTWSQWKTMVTGSYKIAQTPWNGNFYRSNTWLWAYENCHYGLIRVLVTHPDNDFLSNPRLLTEAAKGDTAVMDALLEATWPPNVVDVALHRASQKGYSEIVERLFAAKASVDAESKQWSALQLAARYGHSKTAGKLLAANANMNAVAAGSTALQLAVEHGHLEMVERLLAAKADVHITTESGLT